MILDRIAADTVVRVAQLKEQVPLEIIREKAYECELDTGFPMEAALKREGMSFICEVKKASPSKGVIAKEFPYLDIAREYEAAGAAGISVLTEPKYFQGKDAYLEQIAEVVSTPILRKDFVVDAYQIYEAKVIGASAVLLICAILEEDVLMKYLTLAHELGLSALVEAHTADEAAMALHVGARIIGVNNRNLQTFDVDMDTSLRLRELVSRDTIYISESGIHTPEDIRKLSEAGVDGVLVGESLMRSEDKKVALAQLRSLL